MSDFAETGFNLMKDYYEEKSERQAAQREAQEKKKLWNTLSSIGTITGSLLGGPVGLGLAVGSQLAKGIGGAKAEEEYLDEIEDNKFDRDKIAAYKDTTGGYKDDLISTGLGIGKTLLMQHMMGNESLPWIPKQLSETQAAVNSANAATQEAVNKSSVDMLSQEIVDLYSPENARPNFLKSSSVASTPQSPEELLNVDNLL